MVTEMMGNEDVYMSQVDWLDKPYYSLNAYMRHSFGQKIYKIAVDAGLSCPNRDGSLDHRGCIFCSAGGSGDFAVPVFGGQTQSRKTDLFEHRSGVESVYHKEYAGREGDSRKLLNVSRQIERGMARFHKSVGERFVIYFQAYTNTYGDPDYLRTIWTDALDHEAVVGISIATRPDCLGEDVLEVLTELKSRYCALGKFIWIELGLQTIHEKTAEYIRRGYTLSVYDEGIRALGKIGIPYITHVILGLPGETKEQMVETVCYVCRGENSDGADRFEGEFVKPQGIKLQLLHVLRGTDLAKEYADGKFRTLDMDAYIDLVIDCLRIIPRDIVIHRVTGDGPKNILLAPEWSGNKKKVLNTFHRRMAELGAVQGETERKI